MLKKNSVFSRVLMICAVCSLIFAGLLYSLSNYYLRDSFNSNDRQELNQIMQIGEKLIEGYATASISAEKLWEEVNPTFHSGTSFLLILDKNKKTLAYTNEAIPYFVRPETEELAAQLQYSDSEHIIIQSPESNSMAIIAGRSTQNGYVIGGKIRYTSSRAFLQLRGRFLISFIISLLAVSVLAIISTHRVTKPAKILSDAAERMIDGEDIRLSERFHGEFRDIAQAFNHMSQKITASFQELRLEKERLRLIIESLNEGIIALNSSGKLLFENAASLQLTGGSDSDVSGQIIQRMQDLIKSQRMIQSQEEPATEICETLTLKEKILLCMIKLLPQKNKASHSQGAVAMIRDITEQERLEKTRRDYVANISHELRTPLTSIRGIAEGLRDGMVSNETDLQRYYAIIVDESTRLSRLVNDLLELSGLQSNPAAFEYESIDPVDLVLDLHARNSSLFSSAGITFRYQLPESGGEILPMNPIQSNEDRLSEVLTIFLDNARKYTPAGGTVVLGADPGQEGVLFFVRDTGIGMDQETKNHVFERFKRAERNNTGQGSGLGLAIAREIMQKMNIPIRLESEPEQGSIFSFVVPYAA